MKKIAANYIFPVSSPPIKNGIIELNKDNSIKQIIKPDNGFKELSGTEYYNGIIVPGFVNSHCHLELSHLKNKFTPKTGMHGFVRQIVKKRVNSSMWEIDKAMVMADKLMQKNGIVAVGDICNTNDSFGIKKCSPLYYHNFIEVHASDPAIADKTFNTAKALYENIKEQIPSSIVPHTPYSVSEKLFKLIYKHALKTKNMLSLHNQESAFENEMYTTGKGLLFDTIRELGIDNSSFKATGKNSLESVFRFLPSTNKILLVHNIYTCREDIQKANNYFDTVYWCFCPKSNLFIEDKLPDVNLFMIENAKLTIGTDSYASNDTLDMLEEIKFLMENFPGIPFKEILGWATLNGAKALGIENKYGSIEPGKRPGLNLIENFDFQNIKLKPESKLTSLAL